MRRCGQRRTRGVVCSATARTACRRRMLTRSSRRLDKALWTALNSGCRVQRDDPSSVQERRADPVEQEARLGAVDSVKQWVSHTVRHPKQHARGVQ